MKEFECPKCNSKDLFIQKSGNQTGLYCGDCGKWIKWMTKDEIRLMNKQITNKKTNSNIPLPKEYPPMPNVQQPKSNRTIKCKLDRDLEDIFISAIRYSIGRQTYMPSIVIGYINPKLQYLSDRFLEVTKKDIEDQAIYGGKHPYGDPKIDKPLWDRFYQNIVDEIKSRKDV